MMRRFVARSELACLAAKDEEATLVERLAAVHSEVEEARLKMLQIKATSKNSENVRAENKGLKLSRWNTLIDDSDDHKMRHKKAFKDVAAARLAYEHKVHELALKLANYVTRMHQLLLDLVQIETERSVEHKAALVASLQIRRAFSHALKETLLGTFCSTQTTASPSLSTQTTASPSLSTQTTASDLSAESVMHSAKATDRQLIFERLGRLWHERSKAEAQLCQNLLVNTATSDDRRQFGVSQTLAKPIGPMLLSRMATKLVSHETPSTLDAADKTNRQFALDLCDTLEISRHAIQDRMTACLGEAEGLFGLSAQLLDDQTSAQDEGASTAASIETTRSETLSTVLQRTDERIEKVELVMAEWAQKASDSMSTVISNLNQARTVVTDPTPYPSVDTSITA